MVVNRNEVIEVQITPHLDRAMMHIVAPNCEFILKHGSTSSVLLIDCLCYIIDNLYVFDGHLSIIVDRLSIILDHLSVILENLNIILFKLSTI